MEGGRGGLLTDLCRSNSRAPKRWERRIMYMKVQIFGLEEGESWKIGRGYRLEMGG